MSLVPGKLDVNLKKRIIKSTVWSIVLNAADT